MKVVVPETTRTLKPLGTLSKETTIKPTRDYDVTKVKNRAIAYDEMNEIRAVAFDETNEMGKEKMM